MSRRGLIVGKFYPPHRGHNYLIDTARAQVDALWVMVCRLPGETPDADLRAEWLREIHPDVNVLVVDDMLDPDDSRAWAEFSVQSLGFAPNAVFTSEEYGDRFARCLGCEHVQVDRARTTVPICATRVRENPLACWEFLEPPVRAYYAKRVCLIGAESTGKTTLAQRLAERFQTVWVPEHGREASERMLQELGEYRWRSDDFAEIARIQCERENEAARRANKVLICDTDAFATSIWHLRYTGERSDVVERIAACHRMPDLYLLSNVDTPFVQDGTRDGEEIREWMHAAFLKELESKGRPFRLLTGGWDDRFSQASASIQQLVDNGHE